MQLFNVFLYWYIEYLFQIYLHYYLTTKHYIYSESLASEITINTIYLTICMNSMDLE